MRSSMMIRRKEQTTLLGAGDCIAPYKGSLFVIERGSLSVGALPRDMLPQPVSCAFAALTGRDAPPCLVFSVPSAHTLVCIPQPRDPT